MKTFVQASLAITVIVLAACSPNPSEPTSVSVSDRRSSERSGDTEIEKKIDGLLGQMTLEEKIGQMTQITNAQVVTESQWGAGADLKIVIKADTAKIANMVSKYHVGSFLNGIAVSPETQVRS